MLQRVDGRRVCLTFDDGPDPRHTPRILDILAEHRCEASFFVLGEAVRAWPGLVRRIVAEGHTLGSHSFSHRRARLMTRNGIRAEVERGRQALEDVAARAPRWFRPPYGQLHPTMLDEAARLGMETVLWTRSAIDWGPLATRKGVARRLGRTAPGDIVLLHDARRRYNRPDVTAAVLPDLLASLASHGLAPVSLDTARIRAVH